MNASTSCTRADGCRHRLRYRTRSLHDQVAATARGSTGRCCIWTIRGRLKLGPLSLDQIAKARSSNATVSRWPAGTSTASS
jgi:hypothetical protein